MYCSDFGVGLFWRSHVFFLHFHNIAHTHLWSMSTTSFVQFMQFKMAHTLSKLIHIQTSLQIRHPSDKQWWLYLPVCCAGAPALMALAGGIRKGHSDGNLDSVFANTVFGYRFCLETFKDEPFMSEAQDSREVWRGYSDSWSAANVDLAQSEGLPLKGVSSPLRKNTLEIWQW